MDWIRLLVALLIPLLLGVALIRVMLPGDTPGRWPLLLGNGMLLGLLALPLLMRILDVFGLPLTFMAIAALAGLLTVSALLLPYWWRPRTSDGAGATSGLAVQGGAHRVLLSLLFAFIALRFATLSLEVFWRPLFPWDATMHWATKARTWFEVGSLVPFVDNQRWLELGGSGVFTDHHAGYPITTPLLQLWISTALGRWDVSLVNLPWLLCYAGLGAAFYGQARVAGTSPIYAAGFTYLLLSMPLLNSHVALAGYADLFLGACYCAALMAFHNWSVSRQPWQAALALVFALCCPLVKNEGFYWLLTFLPALVVVWLPLRRAVSIAAGLLLVLAAMLLLIPGDYMVAGHSLERLDLYYRPDAALGIATTVWGQDNWHLLGYLLLALLPLGLLAGREPARHVAGIAAALGSALLLFLVLFLYTRFALGAVRFTAVGRISLHLAPAGLFFGLLLWNNLVARSRTAGAEQCAVDTGGGLPRQ